MASNEFSLILSCGGFKHNNIVMCSGTSNVLVNFNRHFEPLQLNQIMDFLDYSCGLFDRPIGDWNKVVNTIKIFREKFTLIDDNTWQALHIWLPQHKRCGAFLKLKLNIELIPPDSDDVVSPNEVKIPNTRQRSKARSRD